MAVIRFIVNQLGWGLSGYSRPFTSSDPASRPDSLLTSLYWQQWMLHRRIRRNLLSSELWDSETSFSRKLLLLFEAPFTLLRDVSIPTLQPEAWSKSLAVLHPLASPLVLLLSAGAWHSHLHGLSAPVVVVLASIGPCIAVMLLTHNSRPPASK